MNLDNFLVRPHREWVETYADWDAWSHLSPADGRRRSPSTSPGCPSAGGDDDEDAKRFDLLILRSSSPSSTATPVLAERLREQVQDIAAALLGQTTIPAVAAQQLLLDEVAGDEWWVDVTLPMLELARRRIRGLVRFIEKTKQSRRLHRLRGRARRRRPSSTCPASASAPTGSASAPRPAPTSATTRTTSPCSGCAATSSSPPTT